MPKAKVTLFFDGGCHLCSREAGHYRHLLDESQLALVDIHAPEFSAEAHGFDAARVQRTIHAQRGSGEVLTGIDAFAAIWDLLPRYAWLARLTRTPGVRQSMQAGYTVVSYLRPWLPRRRACGPACQTP